MRVKLTINKAEEFELASKLLGVVIEEKETYGKSSFLVVNVKKPADLYTLGMLHSEIELPKVKKNLVNEDEKPV